MSLGELTGFEPSEPIAAVRTLVIRGGYGSDNAQLVSPLVRAKSADESQPHSNKGGTIDVTVDDTVEAIEARVDAWLNRPATAMSRFLNQGLRQYLQARDESTGMPIEHHPQRLAKYQKRLQEALERSRPLIQIDMEMYPTVHDQDPWTALSVQGFPFGEGHPAREVTSEVIRNFLKTADDLDWVFTSSESESVFVASFLRYPIHPSVISSFTAPLSTAVARADSKAKLQASFWLWRRARTLENFIPLPDDVRVAAIRGFAVARSLGYMTADPEITNQIVGLDGIHSFPKWLLTSTNQANILPALLESMILTFADVPARGKGAFDAYRTMIDLGCGGQTQREFTASGELKEYLSTGQLLRKQIDERRAEALRGTFSTEERRAAILRYLDPNLNRFEQLLNQPRQNSHWRDNSGFVDPPDTLSLEILPDLRRGYTEVRNAVAAVVDNEYWVS
jgi:hypothetical protein